jgi:5-carboxymethyl-2-hydroxymuconate isomerase
MREGCHRKAMMHYAHSTILETQLFLLNGIRTRALRAAADVKLLTKKG